ncbi:MAG: serine/threonine-protein kinase [Candidatus Xenobia bacterium]
MQLLQRETGFRPRRTRQQETRRFLRQASRVPAWLSASSNGRYRLVEECAHGGWGTIYRVHDHQLGRDVALKVLHPELADNRRFVDLFLREARAIGRLEHPNIVPIYDAGETPSGDVYFTMKYVRGETLGEVIHKLQRGDADVHQRYCFERRVQIAVQICEAIQYAHQHGVLHRDLKPENVMIGPFGEVNVMDWGLSHDMHESLDADDCLGTPGFIAPEILTGDHPMGAASDVYALGALLYEFFSLQRPYDEDMLLRPLHQDPLPVEQHVHAVQGRVPLEISLAITKAMARDSRQRFASMRDVANALLACVQGRAPVVCAVTALKRLLALFSWLLDNHAHAVITVLIALATLPPALLAGWWWLSRI